jgi:hypothetical protein
VSLAQEHSEFCHPSKDPRHGISPAFFRKATMIALRRRVAHAPVEVEEAGVAADASDDALWRNVERPNM